LVYENEFQPEEFPIQINSSEFPSGMYLYEGSDGSRIFSGKLSTIM